MENHPFPNERTIFPAFSLPDDQGRKLDVESFRQQRNLVLLFAPAISSQLENLLTGLAESASALANEDAVVLTVVHCNQMEAAGLKKRLSYPFAILADEGCQVIDRFCGTVASIYITDRFREIFAVRHGERTFSPDEVLEWLAHINRQCPE